METPLFQVVDEEQLKKVMQIVREAMKRSPPKPPELAANGRIARMQLWVYRSKVWRWKVVLAGALLSVIFAAPAFLLHARMLAGLALFSCLLTYLLGVFFMFAEMLSESPGMLRFFTRPYESYLQLVRNAHGDYADLLQRLVLCEKDAMTHALALLKFERMGFERRAAVLSGSIDKIGLFPAMAALALLAGALRNLPFGHSWLEMLVPLIAFFHLLNLFSFAMNYRADRVIGLLEMALAAKK